MRYCLQIICAAALLSSCSASSDAGQQAGPQAPSSANEGPVAPPKSPGEALVTRLTWPRPPQGDFAPQEECARLQGSYAFRIALADAVLARCVWRDLVAEPAFDKNE